MTTTRRLRKQPGADVHADASCGTEGFACPSERECDGVGMRDVLCRISDKWTLLVVCNLKDGPLRFNELKRNIAGISQRMLASTLRGLERDGLVLRTVYRTVPPHVAYGLTSLGQTLVRPVIAMLSWADSHLESIAASRGGDGKREDH